MSVEAARAQPQQGPKERFFRYFQQEATALQEQMSRLEHTSTVGGERVDATDHCRSGIARLHKEVQDASSYVPAYDQRIYGQAIKALNQKLDETKASFTPKSRFTFKTAHKNPSAISLSDAAELASQQQAQVPGFSQSDALDHSSIATTPTYLESPPNETNMRPPEPPRKDSLGTFLVNAGVKGSIMSEPTLQDPHLAKIHKPSFASSNSVNISSQVGLHIILPSAAAHATSSGSLTNLCRCIVDMSIPTAEGQPFAGLTVKNVKQSLLVCGSVSGAAHITGVEGSVIVIATRQFRMHECTNCVVYLHVNSRPVIEDCHGIQFAPIPPQYTESYPNMNNSNQWDQVQDFKWLKAQPSPNWSKLPAKDIVPNEIWNKIVADTPGLSLDDILRVGGVTRLGI
ncbi:hypothetical protein MMC17_001122 [Xylographa soralifera]|nr:hypothetical protein [Xylographa soralifera]